MNKNLLLKIINPVIGVLFLSQALTGIFHELIPYQSFGIIHGLAGYCFAGLVLTHIILNRNWFISSFRKSKKKLTVPTNTRRMPSETIHM